MLVKSAMAALCFMCIAVSSSHAQVERGDVSEQLMKIKREMTRDFRIEYKEALIFMGEIMIDGGISPAEQGMITAIISGSESGHELTARAERYMILFYNPPNMNDLWLVSEPAMIDLIDMYRTSFKTRARVKNFVASKYYKEWQTSNIDNGYKDIRALITNSYAMINTMEEPHRTEGRELLHDSVLIVDKYVNDEIPDFIYNWIKPYKE